MQEHDGHGAVIRTPEHGTQVEGVAQQQVCVSVAVADLELDGGLLVRRPRERDVEQGVEQGLWTSRVEPSRADEGVLMTRSLVPTEPKVQELKFYAPGVGPVLTVHTNGAGGPAVLLDYSKGD